MGASTYNPGVAQTIQVIVNHPLAQRWGFQITARSVSDQTKSVGTFTGSANVQVRCDDGSLTGVPGPCTSTQLEFAEHTAAGTRLGANGTMIFEVQWNPPANEVGDIVFYAAGNAADNNGTNTGDRIYTTSVTSTPQGGCTLSTRPTIRTVSNGASFAQGFSLNSMISIFGLNFQVGGRTRTAARGDFVNNAFPKELGCVAVEIAGQRVPIAYVQTDQINAQAPTLQTTGPVDVRVILNPGKPSEMRSDVATVQMTSHSPAFFKFGTSTSIAAQHGGSFAALADPAIVPGATPATPGETVILYGTGFGLTDPVYQSGELSSGLVRLKDSYTITIGGVTLTPAQISYAGLSPGSISGLYQFNVQIPASVPAGNVPVAIRIGGLETPAATIPVSR